MKIETRHGSAEINFLTLNDGYRIGYVTNVEINEQERGKGYGRDIMDMLEIMARKEKCGQIRLFIKAGDDKLPFYDKLGYERVIGYRKILK